MCGIPSGRRYRTVLRYETRWSNNWNQWVSKLFGLRAAPVKHV